MPWVEECPLRYSSPNAPKKINVLGSFVLSILAGYTPYAHVTQIQGDCVNAPLFGMTKVVGEDSARNGLKAIEENAVLLGCKSIYINPIVHYWNSRGNWMWMSPSKPYMVTKKGPRSATTRTSLDGHRTPTG